MKKEPGLVATNNSPAELIRQVIQGKGNLEDLRGLLALQKDWEANEARKAYHIAMAAFKANPPKISKDKQVSFSTNRGQTSYKHATLANVTEKISTELSKHGLSAAWTTKQNGNVIVTCRITHIQGHSEETTLSAPADDSGSKNKIQQIGSTITYLQRYTILSLTGLATFDMDDDGKTSEKVEYIEEKQLHELRDMLIAKDLKESKFCEVMKVETLETMPKDLYKKAKLMISGAVKK